MFIIYGVDVFQQSHLKKHHAQTEYFAFERIVSHLFFVKAKGEVEFRAEVQIVSQLNVGSLHIFWWLGISQSVQQKIPQVILHLNFFLFSFNSEILVLLIFSWVFVGNLVALLSYVWWSKVSMHHFVVLQKAQTSQYILHKSQQFFSLIIHILFPPKDCFYSFFNWIFQTLLWVFVVATDFVVSFFMHKLTRVVKHSQQVCVVKPQSLLCLEKIFPAIFIIRTYFFFNHDLV